ncbi:MAG: DUF4336 domain-containing protein [Myxococcota bacterium]
MLGSLDRDLWTVDHPLVVPGGLAIGARMTVVRLSDGGLFLHSPVPIDDGLAAALAEQGPVRFVVAPNRFHHFYVGAAAERYPDAEVHVAPGLPEKKPDLPPHRVLGDAPDPRWQADLDQVFVEGAPTLNEVVFLHRASRTVLFTDLCFNVRTASGFATRLFWRLNAALGHFGPTRMVRFTFRDKPAVRRGIDRVLAWDFDRAIVTHGEVLESGAREALREAYSGL